jgi:transcriptional regulator with XRE-family HTH domain
MVSSFEKFKAKALTRPEVREAYDGLAVDFAFLDEVLKARAASGLTQAEVAARVGTTQSAIARLESATPRHSPSVATLQRYARALGYRLEVRLVKEPRVDQARKTDLRKRAAAARSAAGRRRSTSRTVTAAAGHRARGSGTRVQ